MLKNLLILISIIAGGLMLGVGVALITKNDLSGVIGLGFGCLMAWILVQLGYFD